MRYSLLFSGAVLVVAQLAHAQQTPSVQVPPGTAAANPGNAPSTSYVPPTQDQQQPLPPPAPLPPPRVLADGEPSPVGAPPAPYYGEHEYFTFLGSYVIPDKNRDTTRHGGGASLIYGHLFTDRLSLEVAPTYSIFDTGANKGTDFYQYGGTIDAAYGFTSRTQSNFTPFILAGIGGAYEDVQPTSGKKGVFLADAGLGIVSKPVFYGVKLRAEARYVHDFSNQFSGAGHNDYRGSFGIEIPLGHVLRTVTMEEQPVRMVQEEPRPWIDSDGDGVDDEHDKCPNTPHGFKVDSDGCIIPGQTIVLHGVTFEFNKDRLQPNAKALLDSILPAFTGQPTLKVEIGGHTDSIGSASYNQGLSQRRAESVRQYLISQGAKPDQISAKGYGKSQLLINPEKSSDDRELNRRVEFRVLEK